MTPADVKSVDYDEALAGGLITEANPMNEYLDSILSAVEVEAIKNAALRIGFDPMYGVSWSSLSMLLTTCRCDLEIIHDRHDTLFGGKLPAPNMETLKPLAALVLDKHCDLGIATDGDARPAGRHRQRGTVYPPQQAAGAAVLLSGEVPRLARPLRPQQLYQPPAGPRGRRAGREMLRGAGGLQVGVRQDGGDGRRHRR